MARKTELVPSIPAEQAAGLLLHSQGILDAPTRRPTKAALLRSIRRMGYVQLDSINVVARAHDLILQARFEGYRPEHLTGLLERDKALFENWVHDAAVLPTEFAAQWQHRFRRFAKTRREHYVKHAGAHQFGRLCGQVRRRIETEGPLTTSDFEDPRDAAGKWWSWKPAKAALEYQWRTGPLAVSARTNFQKHYDLTERALPELAAAKPMTSRAYVDWACSEALDRLGTATTRELADFWGGMPAKEAAAWSEKALRSGAAIRADREAHGDGPAQRCIAHPEWRKRVDRIPAAPSGVRILAPFDPVIRDRARLQQLLGFDYRFEAFVPAAKRQHGYYVTPLWRGTRPIGRMDPKLDRASGTLRIRGLCFEADVKPSRALRSEVDDALERFRLWLGAERLVLEP
jgi:hypothetical protein